MKNPFLKSEYACYTQCSNQSLQLLRLAQKCTKILEANSFAFAYRLFHEDLSPIYGAVYRCSPSSTLPLVIPEQIWIIWLKNK